MDNKLTDNEIIKALKKWIKALKDDYKRLQLLDAPMDCFEESHIDNIRVLSNALNLINRLQAENKEIKYKVKKWKENYECSQVVAGDFREIINKQAKELKTAKADAYKEFAEKANKMITEIYNKHIFDSNDLTDEEKDAIINFSDDITSGLEKLLIETVVEKN